MTQSEGDLTVAAIDTDFSAPLGVGAIVSESFSILFRNFVPVMMLALGPTLLGLVVSGLLNGWDVVLGTADPALSGPVNWFGIVVSNLLNVVIYGLTTALIVQCAYDAKLGRKITPGRYIGPALAVVVPIVILTTVAAVLTGIGILALVIPGLWVYAVLSMIAPAVVIERVGFGGFSRSVALTKGYRWPILGTLIIIFICTFLLSFATLFVAGFLGGLAGGGLAVIILLTALMTAIGYGLTGISLSLIYARLREIKEGVSVEQIASVFD